MVASWMECFYHGRMLCFYHMIMEASHPSGTEPLLLGPLSWCGSPPGILRAALRVLAQRSLQRGCPAPAVLLCHFSPFHPLFSSLISSHPALFQADTSS